MGGLNGTGVCGAVILITAVFKSLKHLLFKFIETTIMYKLKYFFKFIKNIFVL